MSNTSFRSQNAAFAFVVCGLVTLSCFPVLGYHFAVTLSGFALLAIAGLLLSDSVMWFSAFWSVRTQSPLMKTVALIVKYAIALCAVAVAALVIALMRADSQTKSIIEEQSKARVAEIQARGQVAKELAGTQGGRSAAREFAKMESGKSADAIVQEEQSKLHALIPAWVTSYGIYFVLPLISLLGAVALSVTASIAAKREEELSIEAPGQVVAAPAPSKQEAPSNVANFPRVRWQGGKVVEVGGKK